MAQNASSPGGVRGGAAKAHPEASREPPRDPTRRAGWLLILIGVVLLLALLLLIFL